METVLIGGGSGLIGMQLSEMLLEKGYKVTHLSRHEDLKAKFPKYKWDLEKEFIDLKALAKVDYIINLAGAGVADKRWSEKRKVQIINSRVESTLLIKKAVKQLDKKPKAIICASAIGYYGDRGSEMLSENSMPGTDGFLAKSTQAWESAINKLKSLPVRLAVIRIGIVLSTQGGALQPFLLQNKFRLGNYFGNGKQFYSWIHIEDMCRMFIYTIENDSVSGVFNGVGPNPVQLYDFVKNISKAKDRKALMLPVPEFLVRIGMGEMADIIFGSARVSSEKIEKTGFKFKFEKLVPALKHLISNKM